MNNEKDHVAQAMSAIAEIDMLINEPPENENLREVREYRHSIYRKWEAASMKIEAALSSIKDQQAQPIRECNDCNWRGKESDTIMCGTIGPLCPECHETTDLSTPVEQAHGAMPEAWALEKFDEIMRVTKEDKYWRGFEIANDAYNELEENQSKQIATPPPSPQGDKPTLWEMITPEQGNRIIIRDEAEANRFKAMGDREVIGYCRCDAKEPAKEQGRDDA